MPVILIHTVQPAEALAALRKFGTLVRKWQLTSQDLSSDVIWISKRPFLKCGQKNIQTPLNSKSRRRPKLSKKVRTSNGR